VFSEKRPQSIENKGREARKEGKETERVCNVVISKELKEKAQHKGHGGRTTKATEKTPPGHFGWI
jgi:hypothetical protein